MDIKGAIKILKDVSSIRINAKSADTAIITISEANEALQTLISHCETEVVGEKELADKFKKLYTAIDKYAEDKINSTIKRILG